MPHESTRVNKRLVERARRNNSVPTPRSMNQKQLASAAPVNTGGSIRMGVIADLVDGLMTPTILNFHLVSTTTGARVGMSRFMVMYRSAVLERLLTDDPAMTELALNYSGATLEAAVEFIFTNELNETPLSKEEDADAIRGLVQLSHFGQVYGVVGLYETSFRMMRVIVNKIPPLAMAVYDEVAAYDFSNNTNNNTDNNNNNNNSSSRTTTGGGGGDSFTKTVENGIETYALQIIEDEPFASLYSSGFLGPGVQYLCVNRLEALCRDKMLQLEEIDFFHALIMWCEVVLKWTAWSSYNDVNENYEDTDIEDRQKKRERVKEIAKNIELRFIEPSDLITTVKDSDLVEYTCILEAMADQALEAQLSGREYSNYRGKQHIERVVVRDAGTNDLNGIYLRQDRDDYPDYEALYLKTSERRNGEYGLYIWNSVWNIAPLADLSNVCYTCSLTQITDDLRDILKPPKEGWTVSHNGTVPAPNCRLLPPRDSRRNQSIRGSLPSCYRNSLEFLGN